MTRRETIAVQCGWILAVLAVPAIPAWSADCNTNGIPDESEKRADFTGLGQLAGGSASSAYAVSVDGTVVAGQAHDGSKDVTVLYDVSGRTLTSIGTPGGFTFTRGRGLDTYPADGTVHIGGYGHNGSALQAFHWSGDRSGGGSFDVLPFVSGTNTSIGRALRVNPSNGEVFVVGGSGDQAFRWRSTSPSGSLNLGGNYSDAFGISSDGKKVTGRNEFPGAVNAFFWKSTLGMVNVGDSTYAARGISIDGGIVVGTTDSGDAFWRNMGVPGSPVNVVGSGTAWAVNADGSVLVGDNGAGAAFIWDATHGWRDLKAALINEFGVPPAVLANWDLTVARGISGNGLVIAGEGVHDGATEGWVIVLSGPDCNANGVLDACDVAGGTSEDCQPDGVPDECQLGGPPYTYQVDNGSAEYVSGGAGLNFDMVWLNHLTIERGRETIGAVAVRWGQVYEAAEATVYLWSDPDGDGSPADAQILVSASTGVDSGTLRVTDIPDMFVGPEGTSFFTGVLIHAGPDDSPATLDGGPGDPTAGQSWLELSLAPIDPNDLSGAWQITEGNWLVRALTAVEGADCNSNHLPDDCDIAGGTSRDCNFNGVPDECDISRGSSLDCQPDGIPDECQLGGDSHTYTLDDGTADAAPAFDGGYLAWINQYDVEPHAEMIDAISVTWGFVLDATPATVYVWTDPDGDGDPTDAQVLTSAVTFLEDQTNVVPTTVDLPDAYVGPTGTSFFVGVIIENPPNRSPAALDETTPVAGRSWVVYDQVSLDPNDLGAATEPPWLIEDRRDGNWMVRAISAILGTDCNSNRIPDDCDLAEGTSADCDGNGILDVCDLAAGTSPDCNANSVPDDCDIAGDTSTDSNLNGVPDDCEPAVCAATEWTKLLASDGVAWDLFGYDVAIDGDTAVIGAYADDDNGPASGSAYVYRWDGNVWVEEAKLIASNGLSNDYFGEAVAIDGDVVIVGAYGIANSRGGAYVFRRSGATWIEETALTASDGQSQDRFGGAVAVSGDMVVVGAENDGDDGPFAGSAYVFRYDGDAWVEEAKILPNSGMSYSFFGRAVAVTGDVVAIGSPCFDYVGAGSGAAYVFRYDPGPPASWRQEARLVASDSEEGDYFGHAVAVSEDTVAVGAPSKDGVAGASGAGYVFRYDPQAPAWVEEAKLLAMDGGFNDRMGHSIAVDGDVVVAGAYGEDDAGTNGEVVHVFRYDGMEWTERGKLTASDGVADREFGYTVALSGSTAVVGAYTDAELDTYAGAAYLFMGLSDCNTNRQLDCCDLRNGTSADCNSNGIPDECLDMEGDCNHNGVPDECDIAEGTGADCNTNGVLDECDISMGTSDDCNRNDVPDDCELPVPGSTLYVDAGATAGGDNGSNWTDAFLELQTALCVAARAGGAVTEIWVAAGTYTPHSFGGAPEATFQLASGVAVYGGFAGGEAIVDERDPATNVTILDGESAVYHVVTGSGTDATAVLDGFAITRGNANGTAEPHYYGGGMYNGSGSPTLACCTFTENSALFEGGGMANAGGNPTVINCAFTQNTSGSWGGGMGNLYSSPTVSNCMFRGNFSSYVGGAMDNYGSGIPTLTNCTFTGNSAAYFGGGINNEIANLTMINCVLWGNTPEEIAVPSGSAPAVTYSCIQGGYAGTGNIDEDPLFVAGPAGCLYLSQIAAGQAEDSPCVDTGTNGVFDPTGYTTRRDEDNDASVLDMGYHYPVTGEAFVPGDFDHDEDADLDDFGNFSGCFTGPCENPPCDPRLYSDPCCNVGDFDDDGDLDLQDFAAFQEAFTGP